MFNSKSILITGGTGSFSRSFLKHILKNYKPKKVIIFSRDEFKQFEMGQTFPQERFKFLRYFVGDVRDLSRLKNAMEGVDYVVHTAALKQVPAAEYNPTECIQTNIIGSQNVIEAAVYNRVKRVIALSTDKAANPINLYGATKLAADKLFIAANNNVGKKHTRFSIVRYGNVLNSRGSVVPLFKKCSDNGEKFIPVTDKRMTRFWISLNEASEFVVKCFQDMLGGEIFVPKIPSVRILDLAKAIAPKLKIKEIGIRPGEKLHEILCPVDSAHSTYSFKNYYLIEPEILMFNRKKRNQLKKKKVKENFEYNSENNKDFLTVKQIKEKISE
tara:strand:- start:13165 stop:14151 length:987 start_codon:yes stop_codon:yes gene_type:complete